MDQFFAEERLSNYFCIGCKQESQNATLKISIAKHPELLVIHLKRFQQFIGASSSINGSGSTKKAIANAGGVVQGYMRKIRDFISYPLRL